MYLLAFSVNNRYFHALSSVTKNEKRRAWVCCASCELSPAAKRFSSSTAATTGTPTVSSYRRDRGSLHSDSQTPLVSSCKMNEALFHLVFSVCISRRFSPPRRPFNLYSKCGSFELDEERIQCPP